MKKKESHSDQIIDIMNSEIKHTLLPYQSGGNGSFIADANGWVVADCAGDSDEHRNANAQFLINAANNHYQLLQVLKDLITAVEDYRTLPDECSDEINKAVEIIKLAENGQPS